MAGRLFSLSTFFWLQFGVSREVVHGLFLPDNVVYEVTSSTLPGTTEELAPLFIKVALEFHIASGLAAETERTVVNAMMQELADENLDVGLLVEDEIVKILQEVDEEMAQEEGRPGSDIRIQSPVLNSSHPVYLHTVIRLDPRMYHFRYEPLPVPTMESFYEEDYEG